jgi:hypothetical protein
MMSDGKAEYRAYIRRKLRGRGCLRDQLDAEEILPNSTRPRTVFYGYYDGADH